MSKPSSKILREAVSRVLEQKKGIISEGPLSNMFSGVKNVAQNIGGNYRVGSLKNQLKDMADKTVQDWDKNIESIDKVIEKLKASKNDSIRKTGEKIDSNIDSADRQIKNTLSSLPSAVPDFISSFDSYMKGPGQAQSLSSSDLSKLSFPDFVKSMVNKDVSQISPSLAKELLRNYKSISRSPKSSQDFGANIPDKDSVKSALASLKQKEPPAEVASRQDVVKPSPKPSSSKPRHQAGSLIGKTLVPPPKMQEPQPEKVPSPVPSKSLIPTQKPSVSTNQQRANAATLSSVPAKGVLPKVVPGKSPQISLKMPPEITGEPQSLKSILNPEDQEAPIPLTSIKKNQEPKSLQGAPEPTKEQGASSPSAAEKMPQKPASGQEKEVISSVPEKKASKKKSQKMTKESLDSLMDVFGFRKNK
jgi:hypothetical protein